MESINSNLPSFNFTCATVGHEPSVPMTVGHVAVRALAMLSACAPVYVVFGLAARKACRIFNGTHTSYDEKGHKGPTIERLDFLDKVGVGGILALSVASAALLLGFTGTVIGCDVSRLQQGG